MVFDFYGNACMLDLQEKSGSQSWKRGGELHADDSDSGKISDQG